MTLVRVGRTNLLLFTAIGETLPLLLCDEESLGLRNITCLTDKTSALATTLPPSVI